MTHEACLEMIDALIDGELTSEEAAEVRQHLTGCADCTRTLEERTALSRQVKGLPRFTAPDVLRARLRSTSVGDASMPVTPPRRQRRPLALPLAAAAVLLFAIGFTMTLRSRPEPVDEQVVASHIRSLMPGHLTDVQSTNQHKVKPWFNGRVNLSPSVPNLDSAGFPLLGGRLDYIEGKTVAVVVYGRRAHIINVFSWAEAGSDQAPSSETRNGFHLIYSRTNGIEQWIASDLNPQELEDFSRRYSNASP
jgi:anti-sigma factor RsiW